MATATVGTVIMAAPRADTQATVVVVVAVVVATRPQLPTRAAVINHLLRTPLAAINPQLHTPPAAMPRLKMVTERRRRRREATRWQLPAA